MRNLKFTVAYDGTNYHGFQRQKNALAVQEVIERGIESLVKRKVSITAASRTDSGVHARGQVFNVILNTSIPTNNFPLALNTKLPDDIVIIDCSEVGMEFHSRYHTSYKTYKYQIYSSEFASPFLRNYAYHIYHNLDVNKMKEEAEYLIGEHDFSSFRSAGCNAKTPIRNIFDIDITKDDDLIVLEITGDGFLYNMVRIIVGTLVQLALPKTKLDNIKDILLSKNRKKAGKTAPAHGLFLDKIYY